MMLLPPLARPSPALCRLGSTRHPTPRPLDASVTSLPRPDTHCTEQAGEGTGHLWQKLAEGGAPHYQGPLTEDLYTPQPGEVLN